MVGKQNKTPQLSIFDTPLERFINLDHELCILAGRIDWESIEKELTILIFSRRCSIIHLIKKRDVELSTIGSRNEMINH